MYTTTPQVPGGSAIWPGKPFVLALALVGACLLVSAMGAAHVAPTTHSTHSTHTSHTALPASPRVELQLLPGQVVVSGQVPDAAEHATMLRRVRTLYRGLVVHDQLSVGEVTNPNWLSASFLPDLRGASEAAARLSDGTLVLEGQVPTEQVKARLEQSADTARAAGLDVVLRLRVQPDLATAPS